MECSATVISHDLYLYVLSVWVDKCIKWRSVPYLRCELLGCTGSCKSCVKCSSCCNESDCNAICNAPEKEYVQSILKFLLTILASGLELSVKKTRINSKKKELDSEKKQVDAFLEELEENDNTMCCHCSKLPRMLFFENDAPYFELLRELSFKVYEENFCQHSSLLKSYSQEKESIIYLVEYLWTAFFVDKASTSIDVKKYLSDALNKVKQGGKNEELLFTKALIGNPDKNYGESEFLAYKNLYDLTRSIFVFNPELAQKKSQQVEDSLKAYLEYYRIQQVNTAQLQQGNSIFSPN